MPSSSHHHHHRRTGKPGRRTRVNVKIVLALLLLVVLAGVAGGAFLLIRKHRHNPEPYALKGDELVAQGDYKTAIKQYEKAFYYDQNNPAILLKLAHAVESSTPDSPEQAARNLARVIGILHRVTTLDADNEDAQKRLLKLLYDNAIALNQEQIFDQVIDTATDFLKNHPERIYALRYKALANAELMRRRDYDDIHRQLVKDDLESALQRMPDDPDLIAHLSLWNSLQAERIKKTAKPAETASLEEKSEDLLRDILGRKPDDAESRLLLARTLFVHKKTDECKDVTAKLETQLLRAPDARLSPQAATFVMLADTDPAAAEDGSLTTSGTLRADGLLSKAYENFPDDLEIMVNLALVRKRLQRNDEAKELLSRAFAADISKENMPAGMSDLTAKNLQMVAGAELANTYLVEAEANREPDARAKLIGEARDVVTRIEREMKTSAVVDLLMGKILLLEGDLSGASKRLEGANQKFGGRNPEAIFLSAIVLKRMGESGPAAERLENLAAMLEPDKALRALQELTDIYLAANNLVRAEQTVDRMLKIAPDHQPAIMLRSEILLRKQRASTQAAAGGTTPPKDTQSVEQALAIIEPLAQSGDRRAQLQLARLYYENKRLEDARNVLQEALRDHPDDLIVLQQLLKLDVELDERPRALARLDEMAKRDPENRIIGLLREQVEGGGNVLAKLEEVLTKADDPFQSAFGLYMLHRQTGQRDKAMKALQVAAGLKPQEPSVVEAQFEEAMADANWEAARQFASTAGRLNLDAAKGAFWQGRLAMAQKEYRRAAGSFQIGTKERPLYSDGWRMLGDAYRMGSAFVEAENAYQEALKLKPDNLGAIFSLYLVHDARGLQQMAMDDLRRARALAPDNPVIFRAYLDYVARDKPEEALTLREKIAKDKPDDWQNRLAMAGLYQRTQNPDRAKAIFDELLQQRGDDIAVVAAAADHLRRQDQFSEGRALLEKYIEGRGNEAKAADWVALARYLIAAELTQPAVTAYEEAMKLEDPVYHEATRELADWYFNNQFFEQALPLYEKAYGDDKSARLTLRYIETLIYNNKSDKASELLLAHVAANGDDAQTALLDCIIAIELKDNERAARSAERAVTLGPNVPQSYLYRARLNYLQAGEADAKKNVIADLQKSLSLDPSLLAAREMLVDLYLSSSPPKVGDAINQLTAMIDTKPKYPPSRIRLIQVLIQEDNVPEAEKALADAIATMPELPVWYSLRAAARQKAGRPADAVPDLKRAFDMQKTPQNLAALSAGLVQAGQNREALDLLDTWSIQVERTPALLAIRAGALSAEGQKDEAKQIFQKAFALTAGNQAETQLLFAELRRIFTPDEVVAILEAPARTDQTGLTTLALAQVLLEKGEAASAARQLDAARARLAGNNPNLPRVLHMQATASQQAGQFEQAATSYKELVAADPNDFIALNNLSFILSEHLKQPQEAVKYAERALAVAPADPRQKGNVLDTLGWAQYKADRFDEAKLTLSDSVRTEPTMHNQYHLAVVLMKKEMVREAQMHLRNVRKLAEKATDTDMIRKVDELLDQK